MSTYGGSGSSSASRGASSGPASTGSGSPSSDTKEVAKEQASQVGQSAAQAGSEVAQQTKEQAKNVVGEASQQARDLAGELRTQVGSQAGSQLERLVGTVRTFADELREMGTNSGQSGLASEVARQASGRVQGFADYLEQREPADLLDEVRSFARRRSGAFLVGAGLAGVVAGRLVKGVTAGSSGSQQPSGPSPASYGRATPQALPGTYPTSGQTPYGSAEPTSAYGSTEPPSAPHGDPLAGTGPGTYGDPTSGLRPYEAPGTTSGSVAP